MNDTDALLGPWLERFLTQHVVTERNLARSTCKSYRDSFKLLVPFACAELGKQDYRLTVPDLSPDLVRRFLDNLEDERGSCTHTRNLRLTAIRAFARFVASRDPAPCRVARPDQRDLVEKDDVEAGALADCRRNARPCSRCPTARRSTGGPNTRSCCSSTGPERASREATQLRVGDPPGRPPRWRPRARHPARKGQKDPPVPPCVPRSSGVLAELVDGRAADDAVFLNRRRQPFTRFGIYSVVERCAAQVPALAGRKITPHVLRHTTACHLVFADVDINTVRAWLGHSSIDTTNVYAEISLKMKAEAIALCDVAEPGPDRHWKEDKGLMAFLNAY